jgi:hypothetical protein
VAAAIPIPAESNYKSPCKVLTAQSHRLLFLSAYRKRITNLLEAVFIDFK